MGNLGYETHNEPEPDEPTTEGDEGTEDTGTDAE